MRARSYQTPVDMSPIRFVYREHNFTGKRGFLASLSKDTAIVVIDYFWMVPPPHPRPHAPHPRSYLLPPPPPAAAHIHVAVRSQEAGYYASNYGLNWVSEKLGAAFDRFTRLEVVLLPAPAFDAEFLAMISDDRALAALEERHNIIIVPVDPSEADAFHPLIAATTKWARGEQARSVVVRDHWHNVSPSFPFYAVVRKQREYSWMQFCASCIAHEAVEDESSAGGDGSGSAAGGSEEGTGGGGGGTRVGAIDLTAESSDSDDESGAACFGR